METSKKHRYRFGLEICARSDGHGGFSVFHGHSASVAFFNDAVMTPLFPLYPGRVPIIIIIII